MKENQIYYCVCELSWFHFINVTVPVPEPELITIPVLILLRSVIKLRVPVSVPLRQKVAVPTVPEHWSIRINRGIL